MPSKPLNVISHCEKSPWFSCTWNENALYGEYAGRLVLLSLGNDTAAEYWTLRKAVGLFDVPERPLEIRGRDALGFLNRMFTRPVDGLRVGRGRYGLLCHQGGGMVCDGILFRLAEDRFWYVHADNDVYLWLVAHAHDFAVEIHDPRSWVLQVQGPKSMDVLANACDGGAPAEFRYFDAFQGRMGGQPVLVSRTGWTAELGFEVYNMAADVDGPALYNHLLAAGADCGIRSCSQLSMNIRRIEAGILNYPTDMDWTTTPYDMGLGMFVDLEGEDFVGRSALVNASKESRFIGFRCESAQIRFGAPLISGGNAVGRVTAYEISPYLECGVGFARFDSPQGMRATGLVIADRDGREFPVELVDLPFYDAAKNIPRGLQPVDGAVE
ncbi:MAG: aminomethyltransferase family protein [Gammaproteobacteria bacterium]|nr:aminomethyltransferase family protein [Gammaproteobacteria bacterium]MDH3535745.1 aminomethyltransferase family protein [Gammaproteobacteria bacterium]